MVYNAKDNWSKTFSGSDMAWPAEYVIRIFKGKYPKLDFKKENFDSKKILDIGCGDGRNLAFLNQCGFNLYGMEITSEIVDKAKTNLEKAGIKHVGLKVGTNDNIPYEKEYFDYLLSWNQCYYMGNIEDFNMYIEEFNRVLKKEGYMILSIPKKSCFIYKGCKIIREGYALIQNDPFGVRNGEILKIFENEKEIEDHFSKYFKNFVFGSINDDCFGFDYHWHLVVCQKK